MNIRKIVGYVVLGIAIISMALFARDVLWRPATCAQMTLQDISNPNQSIEEYTERSILYDELCDPVNYFTWSIFDISMWGLGVWLLGKKQPKKS